MARSGEGQNTASLKWLGLGLDGPGAKPLGKDLRTLMTPSAVICTGVGAWSAGLGGGGDWGCLANISLYTSPETRASPSDVRAGSLSGRLPSMPRLPSLAPWPSLAPSSSGSCVMSRLHPYTEPRPSQTWLRPPGNHTGAPWKRCMSPFGNGPSPTLSTRPTLTPSSLEHGTPDPALSTAIPHAGDWLNVVPSRALGLHLQDWEFRVSLQYWLGLQMANEVTRVPCAVQLVILMETTRSVGVMGTRFIHQRRSILSSPVSCASAPERSAGLDHRNLQSSRRYLPP